MVLTYLEILARLKEINELRYVKTHRSGDTGIGKTLEDLLGIEENNIPSANGHLIELKSGRKNATSMITLFTKSPLPERANTVILNRYGYPSKKDPGKKSLHYTIHSTSFYNLKGKPTLKIDVKTDKIELVNTEGEALGYWTKDVLKESFERKLPHVMYVKADTRGKGKTEEFWFNEVWLLSGFDFENFLELISHDHILTDVRIGQFPNGKPHDHGTGFRVLPAKLELCFKDRTRMI